MEFHSFLKSKQIFSDQECEIIDNMFVRKTIPKGEIIQKINRSSERILFIESGLIKLYFYKNEKEVTHFFFDEDYFIAPLNSIYFNKSEPYEWKSLEDCQIRVILYHDFLKLIKQIPEFTHVMMAYSAQLLEMFSQKLNLLQFERAFDQYQAFLHLYPNLQNRISLGDTASFLGLTQQTLSVVRAQKE